MASVTGRLAIPQYVGDPDIIRTKMASNLNMLFFGDFWQYISTSDIFLAPKFPSDTGIRFEQTGYFVLPEYRQVSKVEISTVRENVISRRLKHRLKHDEPDKRSRHYAVATAAGGQAESDGGNSITHAHQSISGTTT